MANRDKRVCSGCGCEYSLSHSHIIPRSRRRDLVDDENNITYHCLDCHSVWENGSKQEMKQLYDYVKNMEYIKSVDLQYYELLMTKK